MLDHLSGDWTSPYLQYISNIRGMMGMFSPVAAPSLVKSLCTEYYLANINLDISSYPCLLPIKTFARATYVCEDEFSSVIAQFKLDCANLGNKQPRQGYVRQPYCPVCPHNVPNSGLHLLFSCGAVSALRIETGIQSFLVQCIQNDLSLSGSYKHFVNGLTAQGKPISRQEYLERGKSMKDMRELWLSKW